MPQHLHTEAQAHVQQHRNMVNDLRQSNEVLSSYTFALGWLLNSGPTPDLKSLIQQKLVVCLRALQHLGMIPDPPPSELVDEALKVGDENVLMSLFPKDLRSEQLVKRARRK